MNTIKYCPLFYLSTYERNSAYLKAHPEVVELMRETHKRFYAKYK